MNFDANSYNPNAGNFTPKIINPGTHVLQIRDLTLDIPPYNKEAYFLVFLMETKPIGGEFEGVDIDKNNPGLGKYKGQIGRVKSGRYAFSTYNFQNRTIDRDDQIFKFLMKMADQLNVLEDIKKSGIKAATIEEYIDKVKPYLVGKWGMFTVGGSEYFSDGYDKPNYRLFFPKMDYKGSLYPFSAKKNPEGQVINLLPFNESEHIVAAKTEEIQEGSAQESISSFDPGAFNPGQPAPSTTSVAVNDSPQTDLFGAAPNAPASPSFDPTPTPAPQSSAPSVEEALLAREDDDLPF